MEKNIGSLIKEIRKTKKMTQQKLADESNVSRTYLSDVENNRYNPSIQFLQSISTGLSNGNEDEYFEYYMKFLDALGYIDYDDMENKLDVLYENIDDLRNRENDVVKRIDNTSIKLIENDLSDERREKLSKVIDLSNIELQNIRKQIDENFTLIKNAKTIYKPSHGLNKEGYMSNPGDSLKENTQTKIELENLFNSTQEITIKGKTLTDEEKQKALQILTLTFDK